MSPQFEFKTCLASLEALVGKLCLAIDPEFRRIAANALDLVAELGRQARALDKHPDLTPRTEASLGGDSTSYAMYQLLASFGLSREQLVDVALCDGLHELRILRMLRLTYELSLSDAQAILATSRGAAADAEPATGT